MTPNALLIKTKLAIKRFLKSVFSCKDPDAKVSGWCAIFRDTDHPCGQSAVALMDMIDARGFFCRLPVCEDHHPGTNPWTKRHFDLKGWQIQSITEPERRGQS